MSKTRLYFEKCIDNIIFAILNDIMHNYFIVFYIYFVSLENTLIQIFDTVYNAKDYIIYLHIYAMHIQHTNAMCLRTISNRIE